MEFESLLKDGGLGLFLVVTTTGLVKTVWSDIPRRLIPIIPILCALIYVFALTDLPATDVRTAVAAGFGLGLAASGAHRANEVTVVGKKKGKK